MTPSATRGSWSAQRSWHIRNRERHFGTVTGGPGCVRQEAGVARSQGGAARKLGAQSVEPARHAAGAEILLTRRVRNAVLPGCTATSHLPSEFEAMRISVQGRRVGAHVVMVTLLERYAQGSRRVAQLPQRCPTIVEQLLWKPSFGRNSTKPSRFGTNVGRSRSISINIRQCPTEIGSRLSNSGRRWPHLTNLCRFRPSLINVLPKFDQHQPNIGSNCARCWSNLVDFRPKLGSRSNLLTIIRQLLVTFRGQLGGNFSTTLAQLAWIAGVRFQEGWWAIVRQHIRVLKGSRHHDACGQL